MASKTHPEDAKLYQAIRDAWRKGKTTVTMFVDGKEHELLIRSFSHKVAFVTDQGSKQKPGAMNLHRREEEWLVARTREGVGPVFNVEPKAGCNSRALA